jgi:hypothetical protein
MTRPIQAGDSMQGTRTPASRAPSFGEGRLRKDAEQLLHHGLNQKEDIRHELLYQIIELVEEHVKERLQEIHRVFLCGGGNGQPYPLWPAGIY